MKEHSDRGFTLLEILVVLGLSAIIAATAMPTAARLVTFYQVRGVASQIGFDLARARMQAISQNRSVRITFGSEGGYVVERSLEDGSFGSIVDEVTLPAGVRILADRSSVTFDREGMADGSAVFSIEKGHGVRTLSMNSVGRISES